MIPASAEYQAYEAQLIGARPAVRATFLPYYWPNGINAAGEFVHCAYVAPDRIQADYEGFVGGYGISPVITSNLQIPLSPAVISWGWNSPGFFSVFYWRGADNAADLAAAEYIEVNQGDTLQIRPFYQFKLTLDGFRAWAEDALEDADEFTAWAEDTPNEDEFQGYASDANVPGDVLTYIEELELLGEFTVVRDIEQAGSVCMEAPTTFDDLVAGKHTLLLNNRQGAFDAEMVWTPAPLFSSNKSSFFLASQDWHEIQLKIELGWSKGGWLEAGFIEDAWLLEEFTEFITLFLGKVKKWGPVSRAVDEGGISQPNVVEIYAKDFITDCLQKRIALPAADGTPNPWTSGEYLCKAEAVSGWSPAPILRAAYFEQPNYNELDHVVALGGGAFSLITPGLTGTRAFRATVTGANQTAYGSISLLIAGEMFVTGTMRFQASPAAPADQNMVFLQIIGAGGSVIFSVSVDDSGAVCGSLGDPGKFNILAYLEVPISFALWISPTNPGYVRLWFNNDETLMYGADLTGVNPAEIRFGAVTAGIAESWTIDFDDIEVKPKYYLNAFRVTGGLFKSIGPVYVDNRAQPDSQEVGEYVQTLTRYPEYGMVQITSTDPDFKPSGDVLIRVIENAGGRHALYIIESLLAEAGLTDYIDATALAAAYAACPDDVIHARFEKSGKEDRFGLKDIASLGLPIANALKEITSRCLYWIFVDAGKIKIVPYTGTPPADPVLALTASNKWQNNQETDLENINAFVSAVYGWYERNPSLFYVAGDQAAGRRGTGLDYSWAGPVCCENRAVVKAKVDLMYKFLSAREFIDPVRMSLAGARLELMTDVVSLEDVLLNDAPENYVIASKEVGLDMGNRETVLQLVRFLGE